MQSWSSTSYMSTWKLVCYLLWCVIKMWMQHLQQQCKWWEMMLIVAWWLKNVKCNIAWQPLTVISGEHPSLSLSSVQRPHPPSSALWCWHVVDECYCQAVSGCFWSVVAVAHSAHNLCSPHPKSNSPQVNESVLSHWYHPRLTPLD